MHFQKVGLHRAARHHKNHDARIDNHAGGGFGRCGRRGLFQESAQRRASLDASRRGSFRIDAWPLARAWQASDSRRRGFDRLSRVTAESHRRSVALFARLPRGSSNPAESSFLIPQAARFLALTRRQTHTQVIYRVGSRAVRGEETQARRRERLNPRSRSILAHKPRFRDRSRQFPRTKNNYPTTSINSRARHLVHPARH